MIIKLIFRPITTNHSENEMMMENLDSPLHQHLLEGAVTSLVDIVHDDNAD